MNLHERIYDGQRALEILENEVFQQVFADYRTEITEQWMKSPARAEADREKLWLYLSMLNKLESMLRQTLDSGKLAKKDLQYQETLLDKARGLIGR